MNDQSLNYFLRVQDLIQTQTPFVSVTLVGARGHVPQDPSAKMLVGVESRIEGTVGGGKIEARAIQFAQRFLQERRTPELVTWNLQTDLGMSCGGEVSLFFESHFASRWQVAVFGAGHVAQAFVPLLARLECQITVIDERAEWIDRFDRAPRLTAMVHANPAHFASQLDAAVFVAVMTQGHATDFPILRSLLQGPERPYIGVLGSELKAQKIRQELFASGVRPDRLERLHCPMGLDLGSNDPHEMAISIAAQLLQVRDSQTADKATVVRSVQTPSA